MGDNLLLMLECSGTAEALRASIWGYPLVEAAQLVGAALVVGAIVVLDLRLLGRGGELPAALLAPHLLPLAWAGFGLALATAVALFGVSATSYAANPIFWAKLAVIVGAGANALQLHRRGGTAAPPGWRRLAAAVSLGLWPAAITLGR